MGKKKKKTKLTISFVCVLVRNECMKWVSNSFRLSSLNAYLGYKLDEATLQGMYAHNGDQNICLKAL